ncbi:MAG: hypothetical protein ACUZ8N_08165 [Candidatus Scalindua sp.]
MFERRIPIIETVVFLFLATLSTALYGKEGVKDFSSESKQIEEKIDRGIGLALEAISIAENHKEVKGAETNGFLDKEVNQRDGFTEENVNINIEERAAEKHYKETSEMHNPLITEHIKIQKEKHSKKTQTLTPKHYTIKIHANKPWTKTNIYLKENDIVRIYCKGKVMPGGFEHFLKHTSCSPTGYAFSRGNYTVLPNTNYMAVIGKIGNRDAFYIGGRKEFISHTKGPLYLGINDLKKSVYTGEPINKRSIYWKDNTGYYHADVYVYRK